MITKPIAVTCALGAMVFSSFSPAPVSQQVDPEILMLKGKVAELTTKVETFEKFLASQATAGKSLEVAIARADAEGFTAGINPSSREVLLAGLKAQADAMQSGADDEADEPKEKGSMRGKRRQR